MKNNFPKLLLVGCGAMGGALLKSWQSHSDSLLYEFKVIDPTNDAYLKGIEDLPLNYSPNVIVFAVKPQVLPSVIEQYKVFSNLKCVFISIAAGMGLDFFHQVLGGKEAVIRAMPNLPVTVGQGMTALIARNHVTSVEKEIAEKLFSTAGKVLWVEEEPLIDVVTALSGSGPAYFFRFVESLAQASQKMGLPPETALLLARQTAIGAGKMLEQLPDTVEGLRKKVTSPGGTTAAGLDVFNQDQALDPLIERVIEAALLRARELNYKEPQ